jgi:hypothetical protein
MILKAPAADLEGNIGDGSSLPPPPPSIMAKISPFRFRRHSPQMKAEVANGRSIIRHFRLCRI